MILLRCSTRAHQRGVLTRTAEDGICRASTRDLGARRSNIDSANRPIFLVKRKKEKTPVIRLPNVQNISLPGHDLSMQLITFALDRSLSSCAGDLSVQESVKTEKTTFFPGEKSYQQRNRRRQMGCQTSISFPARRYFLVTGKSSRYKNARESVSESS